LIVIFWSRKKFNNEKTCLFKTAKNIENERLEMKRRKNLNFEKNLAAKLNILVPMLRK